VAHKHQCMTAITTMWTESSWVFPESYTAHDSWIVRSSDGGQRGDKRAHNSTTKVSFCTIIIRLCHCTIATMMVHSQNLCSPFLRAVRLLTLITLINYIMRHNFSPTRSVICGTISPTRSVTLLFQRWSTVDYPQILFIFGETFCITYYQCGYIAACSRFMSKFV